MRSTGCTEKPPKMYFIGSTFSAQKLYPLGIVSLVTMIILISCLCIKERLSYNNATWILNFGSILECTLGIVIAALELSLYQIISLNSLVYNSATASSIYGATFSYYICIYTCVSRKWNSIIWCDDYAS